MLEWAVYMFPIALLLFLAIFGPNGKRQVGPKNRDFSGWGRRDARPLRTPGTSAEAPRTWRGKGAR